MGAASIHDRRLNTSLLLVSDNDTVPLKTMLPAHTHMQNSTSYMDTKHGCMEVRFSEMNYLPWNNSDNIVSAEGEHIARKFKDNLLGLLFLVGGPGNIINMAVFYKQGLKDRVNLCLFALSLTDELVFIVFMLMFGEKLHMQFTTIEILGPLEIFLTNENLRGLAGIYVVSQVISAIVAFERCYCVLRPHKVQTLMRTRTMAGILITVYVLVITSTFIVAFKYRIGCMHDPESGLVFQTHVFGELYLKYKDVVDLLDGIVLAFGLPWIVLVSVITSTIITVVKLRQIATWRAGTSSTFSSRDFALTKMLVGNSILFIVCVLPMSMVRLSWLFFPEVNAGRRHHNLFSTLAWLGQVFIFINSSFNIFVYYAMGSRYREIFWALFSKKKKKPAKL